MADWGEGRGEVGGEDRARVRGQAALGASNNGSGGAGGSEGPAGSGDAEYLAGGAPIVAPAGESGQRNKFLQRFVLTLALVWCAIIFSIVFGALVPRAVVVGAIGTLFESFFSLHIFLASLIGLLLANWAWRLGATQTGTFAAVLAVVSIAGSIVPIVAFVRAANQHGAVINWGEHLRASAPGARAMPNRTELYATVEGKPLYADIYLPPSTAIPANGALSSPVVMMHGGGYSGGRRSQGTANWDRWLAERGYTVFDIDYRLDPPPTWKDAGDDAACALAWVAAHAAEYHIAPGRLIVGGQSAGAGLALQVAYAMQDGTFASSCGGTPPQPEAVVAFYPPDDFALGWRMNTGIFGEGARALNTQYIGGSPEQYPQRYRAVSAVYHVREGLPPTFVAAGAHDHLVPWEGHKELADDLNLANVPNVLVTVPYSDHAFDLVWGSLGGQITRRALVEFLTQYSPPAANP